MPENDDPRPDAMETAERLVEALEAAPCDYAIGGALALGYWGVPRGTIDVDVTLYAQHERPSECVRLLQKIGCDLNATKANATLTEHGFCQVEFCGRRLDVFLPLVPFYEVARTRRRRVPLGRRTAFVWDAETLCVFKMMFFRRKDVADVEQILRTQAGVLDREWITRQLTDLFGRRDPRLAQWRELLQETSD